MPNKFTTFWFPIATLILRRVEIISVDIIMYPHVMSLLFFLMLTRMPWGSVRKDVDVMLLCGVYGK